MKTKTTVLIFAPEQPLDNTRLAALCGPMDENLRQISKALDVSLFRRAGQFIVSGDNAAQAVEILEKFYNSTQKNISIDEVQLALVEQRSTAAYEHDKSAGIASTGQSVVPVQPSRHGRTGNHASAASAKARPTPTAPLKQGKTSAGDPVPELLSPVLKTRRSELRGRTPHQIAYLNAIMEHDVTFGIGPAGTGKTYLAVACAVDALERDAVLRSKPVKNWDSCRAIWHKRSIPICARYTMPYMICWVWIALKKCLKNRLSKLLLWPICVDAP